MSNALRVAHAAYSLELDDEAWLKHLADTIGPLVDRGRGLVAFRWHLTSTGKVEPKEMTVTGGLPGDSQMLRNLLGNLDERRAYLAYGAPYIYRSLSEIAQDHPVINDLSEDSDMGRLARPREVSDFDMLRVDLAEGKGWMFSTLRTEPGGISEARRKLWEMVGVHIAAGARLRRSLERVNLDQSAAVFDGTNGELDVRDDTLKDNRRRRRLLELIEARQHANSIANDDPLEAMQLWQGLIDGRWSLLDIVDTDGRAFTVLRENPLEVRSRIALSERERQVAYLVGRGHHIKLVAYKLGVSPSTVRSQLRSALQKLNLSDRYGLCRLVATVSHAEETTSVDSLGILALTDTPLRIPAELTEAEREVTRLVYEGHSNPEIAARRGTATRTVANQLQSIYRKLNIVSREELIARLTDDF